ncbi:uridylate kinase [Coralliovum pocilloporae]|uniref:uridylate kinase n=1 Tax=Coralliovum pocilloporae TaxID=3066369 RepID=UPI0033071187
MRVAVNGRIASGKTTLAREVTDAIVANGRSVRHVGVDGFHNPRAIRYRQGRASARGYYEDAYDLDALATLLLKPLGYAARGQNTEWTIRTASFDLEADLPVHMPEEMLSADCIVIVDGSFLLRTELRGLWDYTIFLDVDREVAQERGAHRDADQLGGVKEARRLHDERYQAACDLYLQENKPREIADAIVQNAQIDRPTLTFRHNSL